MTFEEWWNEEGRGPTTKGEPEHFWAEKSWSASRQAAIEEAAQVAKLKWNDGPCVAKECAEISDAILDLKKEKSC